MSFVILTACGLFWWVNASWRENNAAYLEVQAHIRLARGDFLRGYQQTQRIATGEGSALDPGRCAFFEQAAWRIENAIKALEPMRQESAFRNGFQRIAEGLARYRETVLAAGDVACGGADALNAGARRLEMDRILAESEAILAALSQDISTRFRHEAQDLDGLHRAAILVFAAVMGAGAAAIGVAGMRHRQAEEELRRSEERFRLLVESSADAVFVQTGGRFAYVNPACVRLFGASSQEELLGLPVLERISPNDRTGVADRIKTLNTDRNSVPRREETILRQDGTPVTVEVSASPMPYKGMDGALVYAQDISERKAARDALLRSLHEKEALLREVHHRVKNNLQVVLSLMDLQASEVEDPEMLERYRQLQGRVRTMAMLHEQLCRSDNLGAISLRDYMEKLLEMLARSFDMQDRVSVKLALEDIRLSIDKAAPCGLLLNELVTNAFQHAFSGRAGGELRVDLHTEDGEIVLVVGDDGPGLPAALATPDGHNVSPGTLGLLLVRELARQLRGSLRWQEGPGVTVELRFPAECPSGSARV
ncbi:sensor histidine kinase [Fundidesulfovibrio magnetotacticus]|uniref:sensor histidine kinase n=1 Tax=Fundidesulfovibrio magnetotacticus TaxID=2730080 RepID=UPI00156502CE|nr:histidine kinase dimerization/phosphoacceptor domain -containing protein [Fundidesulfovibrio magnetotacticus]